MLRRVKENDGVVMVSFVPTFSSEKARAADAASVSVNSRTSEAQWVVNDAGIAAKRAAARALE